VLHVRTAAVLTDAPNLTSNEQNMLLHPYGGADLRLGQRQMLPQSSHSGTLVMRFVFDEVTAMRGLRVWNYNGIGIIITAPPHSVAYKSPF
jgi:hypothetical protein